MVFIHPTHVAACAAAELAAMVESLSGAGWGLWVGAWWLRAFSPFWTADAGAGSLGWRCHRCLFGLRSSMTLEAWTLLEERGQTHRPGMCLLSY